MAQSNHRCNAYCRPPDHCDVIFVDVEGGDFTSYDVTARLTKSGRVKVTRVEKAFEVPSGYWEKAISEWLRHTAEENREPMRQYLELFYREHSWLVWWMERE